MTYAYNAESNASKALDKPSSKASGQITPKPKRAKKGKTSPVVEEGKEPSPKAIKQAPIPSKDLGNFVVPSQGFRILIFENDFQFHFRILIFENVFEFHFRILIFDSRLLLLENRRKIKNDHDQGTGENPYAVALLNWKGRYLIKNVRIKSSWLRGKLQLTKIPSARPLNVAHVNVLRDSFVQTGSVNPNLCLCFWGMHPDNVKTELDRINGNAPLVDQDCIDSWFKESQELGPIEGQHSFHALLELNKTYPNKSLWQTADTSVIICSGSPEDIDMVHAIGQQSNFKGTKFLKPELGDLVNALHLSYMHVYQVAPNNEVPADVLASIKQRWSQYNGILSTSVCQYWTLAHHTGEIWTKIAKILDGNVVKIKGRDFKIPRSLHNFTQMGAIPDSVLAGLLENVCNGTWTLRDFSNQCIMYKATMQLRGMIIEFLQSLGSLQVGKGVTWDQAKAKYPKLTDEFVDTFVPTMSMMGKRSRALPESLKLILRDWVSNAEIEARVQVLFRILIFETHSDFFFSG